MSRRLLLIITALTVCLLGSIPVAQAHWLGNYGHVVEAPQHPYNCTWVHAQISEGSRSGGVFAGNTRSHRMSSSGMPCYDDYERPGGYLRVKITVFRQPSTGGVWTSCITTGWAYNTNPSIGVQINTTDYSAGPCGGGKYLTIARGEVYVNGVWWGDELASPQHGIGNGFTGSAANEHERPVWVRADGRLDRTKLPRCFQVSQPNGDLARHRNGTPVCVAANRFFPRDSSTFQSNAKSATVRSRSFAGGYEYLVVESLQWPNLP